MCLSGNCSSCQHEKCDSQKSPPLPSEWAIAEAASRGYSDATNVNRQELVRHILRNPSGWTTYIEFARMIEKYESHLKPVDPLLMKARRLYAALYPTLIKEAILRGEYDTDSSINKMLKELKKMEAEGE